MGFLDALTAQRDANIAYHQAVQAASRQKIADIKARSALADQIVALLQPQMTVGTGPDVPAGSGGQGQAMEPNPALTPQVKQGESFGSPLLDALVPQMVREGDYGFIKELYDPKTTALMNVLGGGQGGMGGMAPEAGAGGGSTDQLEMIIERAAKGDAAALAAAGRLKALGIDVMQAIERKQQAIERTPRKITDTRTGRRYSVYVNKLTGEEVPGSRMPDDDITLQPSVGPGGKETRVPYVGPYPLGSPALESGFKPFDVSLPPGSSQQEVDRLAASFRKAEAGDGRVTKLAAEDEPIGKTDLTSWINPQTGQFPTSPMSPKQLTAGGFVPFQKVQGEQAPRFAKAVNALGQLPTVVDWLFDEQGGLRNMRWLQMKSGVGEGNRMRGVLLQAAWSQIRNESGAAVTDKEVSDLANQYVTNMLSITDPTGMREGIERLGADLKGYVDVLDPTGANASLVRKDKFKLPGNLRPKKNSKAAKKVVRRGTIEGKKVVQYSDGSIEYAR